MESRVRPRELREEVEVEGVDLIVKPVCLTAGKWRNAETNYSFV